MTQTPDNDQEPVLSAAAEVRPVMLFDGVRHLCSGWVRFAIVHDPQANLRFAAIQLPHGQDFLRRRGLPTDRIARNRYRLFGRRDSCLTPTPELRGRFLE